MSMGSPSITPGMNADLGEALISALGPLGSLRSLSEQEIQVYSPEDFNYEHIDSDLGEVLISETPGLPTWG